MAAPQNFRSAFNGFNREDVVNYISYMTGKHENQLNQVRTEMENLRNEYENRPVNRVDEAELEALRAEVEKLRQQLAQKDELIEQLSAAPAGNAPTPEEIREQELSAYRRAEDAERRAMERVNQMYDRANGIIAEMINKVGETAGYVENAVNQVRGGLDRLENSVGVAQSDLNSCLNLLASIRPEEK